MNSFFCRPGALIAALFLAQSLSFTQETSAGSQSQSHPSSSEVKSLLDRLGGLRIEYKADLGLSILEKSWSDIPASNRVGALMNIFETAPSARHEAPVLYASENAGKSSASQVASASGALRLSTLDIQTRAVRLFMKDMPGRAAALYARISLPGRRSTCASPLVEDLSSYYETAQLLMRDERIKTIGGQEKHLFLLDRVRASRTPEALAPLVISLKSVQLDHDDLRAVAASLSQNFVLTDATDREMKALAGGIAAGISDLIPRLRAAGIADIPLLSAYRAFLVQNLSKEYCSDSTANRGALAESFNNLLPPEGSGVLGKLNIQELKPKNSGGAAQDPLIPINQALFPQIHRILDASHARDVEAYQSPKSPGDIQPESADVQDVLRSALTPISAGSACSVCDFYAQAQLFVLMDNALPPGQYLETAITSELGFLSFNRIEDEEPIAFLGALKAIVLFARPVPASARHDLALVTQNTAGNGVRPMEERDVFKKELRNSGDPVIAAYGAYEDVYRPNYATSM